MSCCPAKMVGTKATASAVGVSKSFRGTNLFVAGPATAKAGVISIPDIFGPDSGRIKQDAEHLGSLGYAVVVVDAAAGEYPSSPETMGDVPAWLAKHNFEDFAGAHVANAIAYLQEEAGVAAISSVGYCWGAYVGAVQSTLTPPVLKGHVSFHPSWMAQAVVKGEGAVEKMAENITVPQLLLAAGNDPEIVREGGAVEKILKAKADIGALCDVVDFPDMVHGWVCRGDLEDPATKTGVMKAWHAAIKFTQTVNPVPTTP